MRKTYSTDQAGFSLLELSVGLTIMALVTGAVVPAIGGFTVKAKLAATKMNARVMQSVVEGFATENNGEVPTTLGQYGTSNSYKPLTNPFSHKSDVLERTVDTTCTDNSESDDNNDDNGNGKGKKKGQKKGQKCKNGYSYTLSVEDATQGGPYGIMSVDPQNVALVGAAGAVLYVPFRNASEAQTGISSTLAACTADGGCKGFTSYTLQGMQPAGIYGDLAIPMTDLRVTRW